MEARRLYAQALFFAIYMHHLSPADAAFEIVSRDELHLTLTVFENDAARLSVGQKLICSTNSRPDVKYTAVIHLIRPISVRIAPLRCIAIWTTMTRRCFPAPI